MLKKRDTIIDDMRSARNRAAAVRNCSVCGNLDTQTLQYLPRSSPRPEILCVVKEVADLWALERSGAFRGRYHV